MDTNLSGTATVLYGCLGGFVAYIAVFAIPELRDAWEKKDFNFSLKGAIVISLLALLQMAIGGFVAGFLGDATIPKHAIAYGLGAEGIIGGYVKGAL